MVNPVDAAIEKMLASSAATYPKRHAYFAHRYCRLLAKTCAANEIGHVAFTLCVTVAMVEDSKRYKGAVTFYNEQLMPLIGVKKWEALDLARRKAADHGWLYYDSGGRHKPGRYWVTIPAGLHDLEDTPCDESSYPVNGELDAASSNFRYPAKGELEETHYPVKGYRGGDLRGELDGDLRGYRGGELSYLTLPLSLKSISATETDGNGKIGFTPDQVFSEWQKLTTERGLPVPRKLTKERREKIRVRLKSDGWSELFCEACRKIPIPNTEKFTWQPDLDWMIANNTNVLKIVEGRYDSRQITNPDTPQPATSADHYAN